MSDATFQLGAFLDDAGDRTDEAVAYEADDLTTHGVIVGMTGSGKTGLGVVMMEEALRQNIPTLVIDPKGDMGNLLLTFPDLSADDFAPWVPRDTDPAETAETWRSGLEGWGLAPNHIAELRDGHRFCVLTPGSTAGLPVNLIGSLAPPVGAGAGTDGEAVTDEIEALVSGILGLVGITADPLADREHILLANIIATAWAAGETLDLATLLTRIQDPPMRKLGVIELDQFFPKADRTKLMMKLNGLLASPGFAPWTQGAPLDVESLLWDENGRAACTVLYLAHLSESERQMVVSLVLSKMVTWMRGQSGSTDLRALIYMDEVYGYVPPTAQPPSKKPILTLFKQARAFGVGVVLSTQNPVDLDYKAISNAGTWMIGRLQTERDKARLLDGMSSAAGAVDLKALSETISGLGKRQFLMQRTGGSAPRRFGVRWAMSYLAGPLSKDQVGRLPGQAEAAAALTARTGGAGVAATATAPSDAATPTADAAPDSESATSTADAAPNAEPAAPTEPAAQAAPAAPVAPVAVGLGDLADDETPTMPQVADGIPIRFVDAAAPWAADLGAVAGGQRWEPAVVARVELLYDEGEFRAEETYEAVFFPLVVEPTADTARAVDYDDRDLLEAVPHAGGFALPAAKIASKTFFTNLERSLKDQLYRGRTTELLTNPELKLTGRPGETREQFEARASEAARAAADAEADKLRVQLTTKADRIRTAIAKEQERLQTAQTTASTSRTDELISGAGSVFGALMGGRRSSRSIATAVRSVSAKRGRTTRAAEKVEQYGARIEDHTEDLTELETTLADAIVELDERWALVATATLVVPVPLEKNDITVSQVALAWVPVTR
ncbi:MAG: ATP-binding protein [Candidatus Microthrix sp.]|nr:ATP-binding protein [Candidatus Microthrix sp.]